MKIVILDGSAANPGDITWKALENLGEVTAYDITSKDQLIERLSLTGTSSTSSLTSNTLASLPQVTTLLTFRQQEITVSP